MGGITLTVKIFWVELPPFLSSGVLREANCGEEAAKFRQKRLCVLRNSILPFPKCTCCIFSLKVPDRLKFCPAPSIRLSPLPQRHCLAPLCNEMSLKATRPCGCFARRQFWMLQSVFDDIRRPFINSLFRIIFLYPFYILPLDDGRHPWPWSHSR